MSEYALEMMIPIISVISVFTFLTIIVVARYVFRGRERQGLYETARLAIEKGQALPPDVIAELAASTRRTAFDDLRAGCIWLAVGLGAGLFGLMISFIEGAENALNPLVGLAAVPTLVGVALIVLSRFNPNKNKQRES